MAAKGCNNTMGRYGTKTSRPRASNGHRFPCPALLFYLNEIILVFMWGNREAAPVGDKVLYNGKKLPPICLFAYPPIRLSVHLPSQPELKPEAWLSVWVSGLASWASGLAGWPRSGDEQTDVQMNGTEFLPFYRTSSLTKSAAQKDVSWSCSQCFPAFLLPI